MTILQNNKISLFRLDAFYALIFFVQTTYNNVALALEWHDKG